METDVLERTDTRPQTTSNDGDHDRFAHIAPARLVAEAYVTGLPITALCGKKWVPSRDPSRYPVCRTCLDVAGEVGCQIPKE